jgi:UDP-N-acetylglucosamine:LPS N-acetylglucosamine transferase
VPPRKLKLLALSSGGGHWVQLLRLRPAFAACDVSFATARRSYQADLDAGDRLYVIPDCNLTERFRMLWCALSIFVLLVRLRPDIVISTGSAPGFFAVSLGRLVGARTIWVDSVANAEVLSLSGQKIGRYANLWLTQWAHLARPEGPFYHGSVL